MRFFVNENVDIPVNAGDTVVEFERLFHSGPTNSWWGVIATVDSGVIGAFAKFRGRIKEIDAGDYEKLRSRKNLTGPANEFKLGNQTPALQQWVDPKQQTFRAMEELKAATLPPVTKSVEDVLKPKRRGK